MSDAYIGVPFINEVSPRFPKEDFVASDFGTITISGTAHTNSVELTLDVPGANTENLMVVLDNVIQEPDAAYTIHENASSQPRILKFSETPASGAIIYVTHRGIGGYNIAPPAGSVGVTELSNDLKSYTVDSFTGDGSDTTFTLNTSGVTTNNAFVYYNGVALKPTSDYTINTSTGVLTVTFAPIASSEIVVRYQL
jgi:hypothetical protein